MGRLSKEAKQQPPKYTEDADFWMQTIGRYYEKYKGKFYKYARDNGYAPDEDLYNHTLLQCYESISRNGLKDKSDQGCLNYFFMSWRTNINAIDPYAKRLTDTEDDELTVLGEEATSTEITTEAKVKQQVFDDYATIYIMDIVEQHFDTITFNCFRLKYLGNGLTYQKLIELTKVKDAKKRVVSVNRWLKENITRKDIEKAFAIDFPDFN